MTKSYPLTSDQQDLVAHLCAEAGGRLEWISTSAITIRGVEDTDLSQILEQMIADAKQTLLLLKAARCVAQGDDANSTN
jgi:hypothetical protein